MNAAKKTVKRREKPIESGMKKPLIYSFGLHIVVVILATFGLPYFIEEPELKEMAITVELADLAAVSETNVVDKPNESEKPEPVPPKPEEPKPVYKQTEAEPEPTPPPPDDLLTPQKPEVEEVPEPEPEKLPEPTPEKVAEIKKPPKPMNKPKPPKPKVEKPKEEKPKEEKPKEEPKKEEEKPKEQEKDFSSLLKSLTPEQEDAKKPVQTPPTETSEQGQTSQLAALGEKVTRQEQDVLNGHISKCWIVDAGGKYAEDLAVELKVFINPDMSVKTVEFVDQMRMASDPHYKAAAESARRALLNQSCKDLPLPKEDYDKFNGRTFQFNPSEML